MSRLDFDVNMLLKIINESVEKNVVVEPAAVEEKKEPVKPKRCQHEGCKVKLMLADFPCRCKSFYCSQHRFAENHKCTFDYKAVGKDILTKQMPTVIGSKLERV